MTHHDDTPNPAVLPVGCEASTVTPAGIGDESGPHGTLVVALAGGILEYLGTIVVPRWSSARLRVGRAYGAPVRRRGERLTRSHP